MEALILLSLYDERWFLLGLPSKWGIYNFQTDNRFSNLCYGMAYFQIQLIGVLIYMDGMSAQDVFPFFFDRPKTQQDLLSDEVKPLELTDQ